MKELLVFPLHFDSAQCDGTGVKGAFPLQCEGEKGRLLGMAQNSGPQIQSNRGKSHTSFRFYVTHIWLGFLLCGCLFLTGCFQFRLTEKEIYEAFEGAEHQPVLAEYVEQDRNMHYLAVNPEADSLPLIVFIHGAPGSRSVFLKLLTDSTLASRARMVSVDRAGYGESDFGKAEISIEKQAALIRPLIERYSNEQPTYLVGYSFGGPIAVRAMMDHADLADGMVLVSGALDPEHEKIYWVSYPGNCFFIRWMLPRAVRVTNKEKLSHVAQLTRMLPYWGKVEVPTTVIQGLDDKLVVPENAHFAIRKLTAAKTELILVPNQKHRIPHDQPHIVKNALLEFLDK